MNLRPLIVAALAAVLPCHLPAQTPPAPPPAEDPAPPPAAQPADVATPEAVVAALYDVISGPKGKARDWHRLRSLFHADGRLVPMVKGKDGMRTMLMTVGDYIARSGPMLERDGFFEQQVAQKVQRFGDIAQVFSTYEARRALQDEQPWFRGINAIQLVRQEGRWSILQILWEQERDAGPIPAEFLK